ncbi:hypothetical protein HDU76_008707, partial [Blyttiomyces sp. JEL0837]
QSPGDTARRDVFAELGNGAQSPGDTARRNAAPGTINQLGGVGAESPGDTARRDTARHRNLFADVGPFSASEYSDLPGFKRPLSSYVAPGVAISNFNHMDLNLVKTLNNKKSKDAILRAYQQEYHLRNGMGKNFNIDRFISSGGNSRNFSEFITGRLLQSDNYNAIYNLDGVYGLWAFNSVDNGGADADYLTTVIAGLLGLEAAGVNNLIIDTSDNPGGNICLGLALLGYIANKPNPFPYDIRLSDTLTTLMQYADTDSKITGKTAFSSQGFVSYNTHLPIGDLSKTGSNYNRGGVVGSYSEKFQSNCQIDSVLKMVTPLQKGWAPSNIFILSNGKCGSTCAEFTRLARDQFGIRTLTYGGSTNTAFQPSSYEGGVVQPFQSLYISTQKIIPVLPSSITQNKTVMDSLPQSLPLYATGSLPFWESYSPQGKGGLDTPCEFIPENSEAYVAGVVDWVDKPSLWSATIGVITKQFNPPTNVGASAGGSKSSGEKVRGMSFRVRLGVVGLILVFLM